jgi:class 3 adenylate cyclase
MSDDAPPTASEPTPSPAGGQDATETWRRVLTGEDPGLPRLRRLWRHVPSSPRCKLCAAPFRGPGRVLTRALMHGSSTSNPLLCNACFGQIGKMPGGAEVEISVLFADIRGSTGIAERTSAGEFRRLVQQFYLRAAKAIHEHDGIVDKFLGDGIMALFGISAAKGAGSRHALLAAQDMFAALDRLNREFDATLPGALRMGVGVHMGPAVLGRVGGERSASLTALGDTVNTASRIEGMNKDFDSMLVVSDVTMRASGLVLDGAEIHKVAVRGREEMLTVHVAKEHLTLREASKQAAAA